MVMITKVQPKGSRIEPTTTSNEAVKTEASKIKKGCWYCQKKTTPCYTDSNTLRRFLSDRSRILPVAKSNLCAKHQRKVSQEIKRARFLALLPFTVRV